MDNLVNIHEAKTHLSRLLQQLPGGEEIVIAKAGRPMARLVPVELEHERKPGKFRDSIQLDEAWMEPLPEEELKGWEGDGK